MIHSKELSYVNMGIGVSEIDRGVQEDSVLQETSDCSYPLQLI